MCALNDAPAIFIIINHVHNLFYRPATATEWQALKKRLDVHGIGDHIAALQARVNATDAEFQLRSRVDSARFAEQLQNMQSRPFFLAYKAAETVDAPLSDEASHNAEALRKTIVNMIRWQQRSISASSADSSAMNHIADVSIKGRTALASLQHSYYTALQNVQQHGDIARAAALAAVDKLVFLRQERAQEEKLETEMRAKVLERSRFDSEFSALAQLFSLVSADVDLTCLKRVCQMQSLKIVLLEASALVGEVRV